MLQCVAFAGPAGPAFSFSALSLPDHLISHPCKEELVFSHHCPWICPQLAHTASTGQATCFAGVASLPGSQNRTQALTGPNSFFLPRTSLPSPFRGRGWVSTFLGSPGLPCSFKTDSHWPNRAGIEPRWCPLPSSQNRTQGHTGASLYLLPFSPSLSRREVTVNYSSTRMSLDRRKYSPQWRFLL